MDQGIRDSYVDNARQVMKSVAYMIARMILLVSLAVAPLYGVTAQFATVQHGQDTVSELAPDSAMTMMDCCDSESGHCKASSQCQSCPSCQHFSPGVTQDVFIHFTSMMPEIGSAMLCSGQGIIPPVEIQPPQA